MTSTSLVFDGGLRCWGVCITSCLAIGVSVGMTICLGVIIEVYGFTQIIIRKMKYTFFINIFSGFTRVLQCLSVSSSVCGLSSRWRKSDLRANSGLDCPQTGFQIKHNSWSLSLCIGYGWLLAISRFYFFQNLLWLYHGCWGSLAVRSWQHM